MSIFFFTTSSATYLSPMSQWCHTGTQGRTYISWEQFFSRGTTTVATRGEWHGKSHKAEFSFSFSFHSLSLSSLPPSQVAMISQDFRLPSDIREWRKSHFFTCPFKRPRGILKLALWASVKNSRREKVHKFTRCSLSFPNKSFSTTSSRNRRQSVKIKIYFARNVTMFKFNWEKCLSDTQGEKGIKKFDNKWRVLMQRCYLLNS